MDSRSQTRRYRVPCFNSRKPSSSISNLGRIPRCLPGFSFWNIHHLCVFRGQPRAWYCQNVRVLPTASWRLTLSKPLKIQIIELARNLIADEQHWCTRKLALDTNGRVVSPMSSGAVKRCALGAVLAAAYQLTHDFDTAHKLGHEALAPIGRPITHVNDGGAMLLCLLCSTKS
jgi:hypothetical protein